MAFFLHQLKKRLAILIGRIADWVLFLGIVLVGGLGSSWYMVEAGTSLTTLRVGPWVMWTSASRPDADPYTRAHYASLGSLPVSTEVGRTYVARYDSAGSRLHSSCEYVIEGQDLANTWWSLAVFDSRGRLIANAAERYAYTRDTAAMNPDGRFVATLGRDARPGNWLPTGGAGRLALVFTVLDLVPVSIQRTEHDEEKLMPAIRKVGCR